MKVYEIREERVNYGAKIYSESPKEALMLGGGSNNKKVPLFRKNPAEILHRQVIREAHPVPVHDGYALAKPNQESDQILVVISSRDDVSRDGCSFRKGVWDFKRGTSPWCEGRDKVLMSATGPMEWFHRQDSKNIGWHDALVVLNVGDGIVVTDQNGRVTRATYESVEAGLVQQ
jgi:hypothetical protein